MLVQVQVNGVVGAHLELVYEDGDGIELVILIGSLHGEELLVVRRRNVVTVGPAVGPGSRLERKSRMIVTVSWRVVTKQLEAIVTI